MGLSIHFSRQNFRCAGHRQCCHLGAQCFAGHICFFIYLAPGCGQDPVAFRTRIAFGFFHHLGFAFFRSTDNLLSLFLGFAGYLFRMLLRLRFGLLPFLCHSMMVSSSMTSASYISLMI